MTTLTLANICLDVQIGICMCLHPSDILSLRKVCPHLKFSLLKPLKYTNIIKTCRAFERITRQRVVWVAALHRVCFENTLFLPSFPISDMSNLEIEKAAMGPRRWIELCAAFERRLLNHPARKGPGAILCPRSTRIINELIRQWDDFHVGEDGHNTIASLAKTTILTKGTNQLLYSYFVIADIPYYS